MKQKLIFAAALLMLCTPVLTACAGKPQGDSSVSAEASQQDTPQQNNPDGSGDSFATVEDEDDLKAATKVLTEFCKGCKKNQADVLEQKSNIALVPQFAAVTGDAPTEETIKEMHDNMIAAYCRMEDYKITEGALNIAALETYANYRSEMQEISEKLREIGETATAEAAEQLFYPISKIYSFSVAVESNGESTPQKMYVIQKQDGSWTVDLGLLQSMVDYMSVSKVSIANQTAKDLKNALDLALTDMDVEDMGISKLSGEYHFDGASLTPADGREDKTEAEIALAQKTMSYYENLPHTPHVYFRLDKGALTSVAVQIDFREIPYYGTWPTAVDEHYMYYFASIDDAMKFAAGEYESAAPF